MDARNGQRVKARGIIHCHTNLSYDCEVALPDLCTALRQEGFSFVALTEHAQSVTPESYQRFVGECGGQSSELFVVIPGLEVRCNDGIEIAGVGITEVVSPGTPAQVVARIRQLGGYAIWVHPLKRGRWPGRLFDCDAVEVLNGKVDGTIAPNLTFLRRVRRHRREGGRIHAIFGIDLHDLEVPRDVWIECDTWALTAKHILEALREGSFVSRVVKGAVSSAGRVPFSQRLPLFALRCAYIGWNSVRAALPGRLQTGLVKLSRPFIRVIKKEARGSERWHIPAGGGARGDASGE